MKRKILIVDDQEIQVATVKNAFLASELKDKVEVLTASNGAEGVEVFRKNTDISFIISDYHMPQMNGFEMLEQIKQEFAEAYSKCVVMMLTTETNPEMQEGGKARGVSVWVSKPIDTKKLVALIQKKYFSVSS